ncbi:GyrI-like domain-containing protein [Holdemania filiformis]|uniref:GyrI-like domain-containing protein n=1 Tax=Holdemania filiformis TaxID=61171 RepID=UPI00349EC16B
MVFTHHGVLSRLAKTYLYLYGTWLPGAQYHLDSCEDFEVYMRPVVASDAPANEVKLFIPI